MILNHAAVPYLLIAAPWRTGRPSRITSTTATTTPPRPVPSLSRPRSVSNLAPYRYRGHLRTDPRHRRCCPAGTISLTQIHPMRRTPHQQFLAHALTPSCVLVRVMLIAVVFATATTAAGRDALVHTLSRDSRIHDATRTTPANSAPAPSPRVAMPSSSVATEPSTNRQRRARCPAEFAARPRPQLGVIPGGSANVFARTFGVDADPRRHAPSTSDSWNRTIPSIGLAHTADRWFLFNTGMGMDAIVVREMERKRHRRQKQRPHSLLQPPSPRSSPTPPTPRTSRHMYPGRDPIDGVKFGFVSNTSP